MSRLLVLMVLLLATGLSGTADASLRAVGPDSQVVICADGHVVTVMIGPDGQPLRPEHRRHCPDCLPLLMGATPDALSTDAVRPPASLAVAVWPSAFPPRATGHAELPAPRGPPSGDLS